ncbi:hypothetical protein P6B95_29000 [Streptomyces atratus]|uniref:hypothetical protein n=1 Tax=Streptomyces atratus TaxID=1893 RepID=UPI001670788B|nr:hypothetical protein [Streptomyces atratus]WPW31022.1 hypothetical protein P6B95_29000 [Streptomyces atratus]GGT09924.1 hypothetical protein GCM10010207_05890 [Streptomyces atratus]
MTAAITAMITAVVGVLGTLFSPFLAQRLTVRQRAEEARLVGEQRKFEERRAQYTAMNRASRQFHTLLKDALHRIRDDVYTEQERAQLEEARLDHRDRYAEAQMIVPERILQASRDLNRVLAAGDAAIKRLDRGLARDGESVERALEDLRAADPCLDTMRELMRQDLGVTD